MKAGNLRIGVLDSGVDNGILDRIVDGAAFVMSDAGSAVPTSTVPDRLDHGSVIARTLADNVPAAGLLNGQIFIDRMTTTPAVVAAGLDWMRERGARLVTLSFGLRADRMVLRDACRKAADAGIIMLAATPSRGGPVYPAGYPGVVGVTGDARLGQGEISALRRNPPLFGAYAWPAGLDMDGRPIKGGASFAVATVALAVANHMLDHSDVTVSNVVDQLASTARYHGPERRGYV